MTAQVWQEAEVQRRSGQGRARIELQRDGMSFTNRAPFPLLRIAEGKGDKGRLHHCCRRPQFTAQVAYVR